MGILGDDIGDSACGECMPDVTRPRYGDNAHAENQAGSTRARTAPALGQAHTLARSTILTRIVAYALHQLSNAFVRGSILHGHDSMVLAQRRWKTVLSLTNRH